MATTTPPPLGPSPAATSWKVLVRDPVSGDLRFETIVSYEQALAYCNGDANWRNAGPQEPPGMFERPWWRRIFG